MLPVHYKSRKISKIDKTDSKIAVIGRVVESRESSFILDDDTGRAEVFFEGDVSASKGKLVRVFCSLVDDKLKADIVQSLAGLDTKLFKKIEELYNKAGV